MKSVFRTLGVSALLVAYTSSVLAEGKTGRLTIAIAGMHCDSCATGIAAMLKRTEGVITGAVSYEKREALVEYDARKTSPKKIVEVIESMGYGAVIKK